MWLFLKAAKFVEIANWIEITAYLIGGPIGITASMASHTSIINFIKQLKKSDEITPEIKAEIER